jgi:hypothetical protein
MVSVLASGAVDRGFGHRSGQTKDRKIDICCFSAKHEAVRRKSKDRFLGIRIMCPSTVIVSDCCLTPPQLYHGENKLIFNEMMVRFNLY